MKYKTKPFEIDAVKFTGDNWGEVRKFVGPFDTKGVYPNGHVTKFIKYEVTSLHDDPDIIAQVYDYLHRTWVGVKINQYIIRGMKGEFYPCDPEVFEAKYEEA